MQAAAYTASAGTGAAHATPSAVVGPPSSSIVQLSAAGRAAAADAAAHVDAGADAVVSLSTAARYKDAGAALLGRFKAGTVAAHGPDTLPDHVDNRFSLGIVTAGGRHVDLALADKDGALIVQVRADDDLGDDERAALAGLAQGFQAALDGMAQDPPQIRLGALAGYDRTRLASVDLQAEVALPGIDAGTQKLAVHLDADGRTVGIDGPAGKADIAIDARQLALLGTPRQQARAIDAYLKQFDGAASRGRADAYLTTMFKDAFAAVSTTAGTGAQPPAPAGRWSLSQDDHAVLTGLADFTASVTQTPRFGNPLRHDEVDGFRYTVAQTTRTSGATRLERGVVQLQKAHLSAQFHQPLKGDGGNRYEVPRDAQNYSWHQIDDAADSRVEFGYRDGRLRTASLTQGATQSERIRDYVLGKQQADRTVPAHMRLARDLVATLAPYRADGDAGTRTTDTPEAREQRRQAALDALGRNIVLLGMPSELAARDARL
jgi:hypothetical protein